MRRCLLCVSLLWTVLTAFAQQYVIPLDGRQQFEVDIEARGAHITGICMVKTDAEGIRGAVVNEFGVHALDFMLTADRRQVRLQNVIHWMDRWYIRRIVRRDLSFLFGATQERLQKGSRLVTIESDGTVTMSNQRYGLTYRFKELKNEIRE